MVLGSDGGPVVYCPFLIMWLLHFPRLLLTLWPTTPFFHSHCRPGVQQLRLHNSRSQYCVSDIAIYYWENKVLSVSSALGQQLKTPRQHRGTEGGDGVGQTLSESLHQILMNLIEVLRHYKASRRVSVFMAKYSPGLPEQTARRVQSCV